MKKKLLLAGTAAAIVAPVVSVVACSVNDYGDSFEYYGDIQTVTDAGSVADKSFNQSAFEATRTFAETESKTGPKVTFGYSQPKSTTKVLMQKAYLSALEKGAKTIILPGFTHTDVSGGDALPFVVANHAKYPNVRYISPDGFSDEDESVSNGLYNLGYAAEESGYLAAVYAGLYFNTKNVENPGLIKGNTLKIATFGGTAIPYGVTSYMDGWIDGMNYFNTLVDKHAGWKKEENIYANGKSASDSDFTGSFDAGAATSKVQTMLDEGVQAILPVAGPQTGDVTGLIRKNNLQGKVFAMGVDVDQASVYGNELVLGSAVKGIYSSTLFALEALKSDPDRKAFSTFNHALESDPAFGWQTTKDKYVKELVSNGMSKVDAENKLMFTGFIPSKMSGQIDVTTGDLKTIYDEAKLQKASNQGAFLGVANG